MATRLYLSTLAALTIAVGVIPFTPAGPSFGLLVIEVIGWVVRWAL